MTALSLPRRAPRRFVICLDGTWNDAATQGGETNVIRVARAVPNISAADGREQIVLYLSGVGTSGFRIERLLEGATGFGIGDIILSAYMFLAQNYEPGDEIFLFGFSRGAFVARSLSGLIASSGLLKRRSIPGVAKAWDFYRRDTQERTPERFASEHPTLESYGAAPITFLGVWDTVGALGVPGKLFGRLDRKYFGFHDTEPSANLHLGCQALAIDEHRRDFVPTLWTGREKTPSTIRQVWFAGTHCDVGGGLKNGTLADIPLLWMVEQAESAGLFLNRELLPDPTHADPLAWQHLSDRGLLWLPDRIRPTLRLVCGAPLQRDFYARLKMGVYPASSRQSAHNRGINEHIHESVRARFERKVGFSISGTSSCIRYETYQPPNLAAAFRHECVHSYRGT